MPRPRGSRTSPDSDCRSSARLPATQESHQMSLISGPDSDQALYAVAAASFIWPTNSHLRRRLR